MKKSKYIVAIIGEIKIKKGKEEILDGILVREIIEEFIPNKTVCYKCKKMIVDECWIMEKVYVCKPCRIVLRMKKYIRTHKEEYKLWAKKNYQKNKKKIRGYQYKWRKKNPEIVRRIEKKAIKKYQIKNREKINKKNREKYHQNKNKKNGK